MIKKLSMIINKMTDKIEDSSCLSSIKNGLIMLVPLLIFGAFASIIKQIPIRQYQEFISSFGNGVISEALQYINTATYKYISILLLICISINYVNTKTKNNLIRVLSIIVAISSFLVLSLGNEYGKISIFIAIICSIFSISLFNYFIKNIKFEKRISNDLTSSIQGTVLTITIASIATVLIFIILNILLIRIFDVESINEILPKLLIKLYTWIKPGLFGTIILQFILQLLAFFGFTTIETFKEVINTIYLGNTSLFTGSDIINIFLVSGFSVIIAIFISSKQKNTKRICAVSTIPSMYGLNDIIMCGIPIILNPILFIPFIFSPIISVITTYVTIYYNLIPNIVMVDEAIPFFINSYIETGSIGMIILQLINIILSVLIYIPFIKLNERRICERFDEKIIDLTTDFYKAQEIDSNTNIFLFDPKYTSMVRSLYHDLLEDMRKDKVFLFFQPIVDVTGISVGCESLLRWYHSSQRLLNPGIVLQIAKDGGIFYEFYLYIIEFVCKNICKDYPKTHYVSINAPIEIIMNDNYEKDLSEMFNKYNIDFAQILIEITEETVFNNSDLLLSKIHRLKEKGFRFAIDDFGVGHTSIRYLQTNCFDVVKIDGSLTTNIIGNEVNKEIITSIVSLAKSLNVKVVCEVIETEEQFKELKRIGCRLFQGFLFSKAIQYSELKDYIEKESELKSVISRYVNK